MTADAFDFDGHAAVTGPRSAAAPNLTLLSAGALPLSEHDTDGFQALNQCAFVGTITGRHEKADCRDDSVFVARRLRKANGRLTTQPADAAGPPMGRDILSGLRRSVPIKIESSIVGQVLLAVDVFD
jgi:hypothetical protein